MMNVHNTSDLLETLAKHTGKWCMYISFDPSNMDEVIKAAPYLTPAADNLGTAIQILCDGCGFLSFDTEEEMERHYKLTVGDDGPTSANGYAGPCRVYALTCNPQGQCMNENT